MELGTLAEFFWTVIARTSKERAAAWVLGLGKGHNDI